MSSSLLMPLLSLKIERLFVEEAQMFLRKLKLKSVSLRVEGKRKTSYLEKPALHHRHDQGPGQLG